MLFCLTFWITFMSVTRLVVLKPVAHIAQSPYFCFGEETFIVGTQRVHKVAQKKKDWPNWATGLSTTILQSFFTCAKYMIHTVLLPPTSKERCTLCKCNFIYLNHPIFTSLFDLQRQTERERCLPEACLKHEYFWCYSTKKYQKRRHNHILRARTKKRTVLCFLCVSKPTYP